MPLEVIRRDSLAAYVALTSEFTGSVRPVQLTMSLHVVSADSLAAYVAHLTRPLSTLVYEFHVIPQTVRSFETFRANTANRPIRLFCNVKMKKIIDGPNKL